MEIFFGKRLLIVLKNVKMIALIVLLLLLKKLDVCLINAKIMLFYVLKIMNVNKWLWVNHFALIIIVKKFKKSLIFLNVKNLIIILYLFITNLSFIDFDCNYDNC